MLRLKRLYKQKLIPYFQVEEKEAELKLLQYKLDKLKNYKIISPVSGVILSPTELKLKKGNYIKAGESITVVANSTNMLIKADIKENQAVKIKPGQKVLIILDSLPFSFLFFENDLVCIAIW